MLHLEHEIIGLIYDAALNPQVWPKALAGMVELTQSTIAIFTALDQLNPHYDFMYTHNIPQKAIAAYQDEQVKLIDMSLHAPLLAQRGMGSPVNINCVSYADKPGSDEFIFYKKCLEPAGVVYAIAVLLDAGKYSWSVLGLHRARYLGEYSSQEITQMQRMGTHLRRALQIHRQISAVQQENRQLYQVLDCLKTGVIIIDAHQVIRHSNVKARSILERSGLLWPGTHNRLKVAHGFQDRFQALVQSALLPHTLNGEVEAGGVLAVTDAVHENALMLTVVPLSGLATVSDLATGLDITTASDMHAKRGRTRENLVAVFITESCAPHQLAHDYLVELYALTRREMQLCDLLVNGFNLEQIAAHCGITLQSARTYLKHILSKTHCSSQAELMRLLMNLTIKFEHIV